MPQQQKVAQNPFQRVASMFKKKDEEEVQAAPPGDGEALDEEDEEDEDELEQEFKSMADVEAYMRAQAKMGVRDTRFCGC